MADAIKQEFGLTAELIQGSGGIFDVKFDGKMIYSKQQIGRFPENEEVLDKLEPLIRAKR